MIKFKTVVLMALLISMPVIAGDYVVNVNGLVGEFCAVGVTKKVSKLSFIDRSKYTKGVKVEIKEQKVTIAVKGDVEIDKAELFAAIESGGYKPVDLWEIKPSGERIAR